MRRTAFLLPALLLLGCPTGDTNIGELGDTTGEADDASSTAPGTEPGTASGTTMGESSTTTGGSQTSSGAGSSPTGGSPVAVCPSSSQCSIPVDCESGGYDCGGITRFDEAGCPRDWCEDDDDCSGTDRCVDPLAWGIPCPFDHGCSDAEDGTCECGFGLSCGSSRHCVTAEVFPGNEGGPAACAARLEQGACETPLPGDPPGECRWLPRGESSPDPLTCDDVTVLPSACLFVTPRFTTTTPPTPCGDGSGRVPWFSPGDGNPSPETVQVTLLPDADVRVGDGGDASQSWIPCSAADPYGVCDCICDLE